MNLSFSLIVAVDKNFGMGKEGVLPWNLPGEIKHFKKVTTDRYNSYNNVVIMGRKTWESIPEKFRPLPGRFNIVVTRNRDTIFPHDVLKAISFDEALKYCEEGRLMDKFGKIFVIGGAELFKSAIYNSLCREIFLTQILSEFECDCFFPPIPADFHIVDRSEVYMENQIGYSFIRYQK